MRLPLICCSCSSVHIFLCGFCLRLHIFLCSFVFFAKTFHYEEFARLLMKKGYVLKTF